MVIVRLCRLIQDMGAKVLQTVRIFHSVAGLFYDTVYAAFRPGRAPYTSFLSQMSRQILYTGVEAFWLVGIIALLCGNAIVLQAMTNMPRLGVSEYFGRILVIVVVGELGPFLTSLVVIGRSGAALATYIGTMRVSKEISALEVMGVDPIHFLVLPSLVGIVGSIICLNVYFNIIAILGGLMVAKVTVDVPFGIFFEKVLSALSYKDVCVTLLKSVGFGLIVALVSCHYGLNVRNVRGVPLSAIQAVVASMFLTIMLNLFISLGYYVL
ncbi:MAG: MlaE family ABC transporter permease [Chitinispirillaceae bacterium]